VVGAGNTVIGSTGRKDKKGGFGVQKREVLGCLRERNNPGTESRLGEQKRRYEKKQKKGNSEGESGRAVNDSA